MAFEPMNVSTPPQSPIMVMGTPQPQQQWSYYGSDNPQCPALESSALLAGMTVTECGTSAGIGSGFLPSYLIGDQSNQGPGRVMSSAPASVSTPKGGLGYEGRVGVGPVSLSTPTGPKSCLTPNSSHIHTPSEKTAGGPPTSGLFTPTSKVGTPKQVRLGTTPVPTTPQLSFGGTPLHSKIDNTSVVQEEIFNVSRTHDEEEQNWVIVFGFPPSAASFILTQFSQYGTIMQYNIPTNGNWMHLKYKTLMQAQKALSKNGRIIGGSIMTGVCPGKEPNLVESSSHNVSAGHNNASILNSSVTTLNSSFGGARLNSSLRPLAQAYKVVPTDAPASGNTATPSHNAGLVGKAMEYIFGW